MGAYTIRGIDKELWKRFHIKALSEGTTMNNKLMALVRDYVIRDEIPPERRIPTVDELENLKRKRKKKAEIR